MLPLRPVNRVGVRRGRGPWSLATAALLGLAALVFASCSQGFEALPSNACPTTTTTPSDQSLGNSSASAIQARGVIVRYRNSAAALHAQAQGGHSMAGDTVLLRTADVAGTITRLKADPNVLYAVPNAILHALGNPAPTDQVSAAAMPVEPTDQYAYLQWAYPRLGYGSVWRDMQDHPYPNAVTVAVLDTGVRYDHPDLNGALIGPGDGALDVILQCKGSADNGDGDGPDTDPTDPATPGRGVDSHGTHVTGIIAARWGTFPAPCTGCSTSGVVGATYTAPVKVLPIRVLDAPGGNGEEADIAIAIRYAAGESVILEGQVYSNPHPAQVINLSLGGPITETNAQPLCDAVAAATARGTLVVAAGGNDGNSSPYYPAACDGAVAVASATPASTTTWQRAYYSNSYTQIALSAPGGSCKPNPKDENDPDYDPNWKEPCVKTNYTNGQQFNGARFPDVIYSTMWDYSKNQPAYKTEFGTSQATPQVTALAALLLSKGVVPIGPGAPATLVKRMEDTAIHLGTAGRNADYGYGLIDPPAALGAPATSP